MASSLLLLLDDIASALDDVAVLTKVAAKKTAGVLGDDLALNAQQVTGLQANREIPVVWGVAKGSLVNKAILVPVALLISQFAHWLVGPLMMLGGAYLCFEGVEKVLHALLPSAKAEAKEAAAAPVDLVELEKRKIKGAIRTDFILSAEIIVISLGTVAEEPFTRQLLTLVGISLLMTVGVYGLVAGIVKIDDLGLALTKRSGAAMKSLGNGLLRLAPMLMKFLSVAGTIAMFLVGGGLLVHYVGPLHHFIDGLAPDGGFDVLLEAGMDALVGVVAGAVVLGVVELVRKVLPKRAAAA